MASRDPYQYTSLDTTRQQIRLLKLKRRARGDRPPHYDLHTFDIEEAPPYKALSYRWGEPDPTHSIRVNSRRFLVRENLFRFLQHHQDSQYLWIDQICIDQLNDDERNHQVNMMSQIYKDCDCVIVWLGTDTAKFREAVDAFAYKPKLEPLSILLFDLYFTRLWIVQEILLARKVRVVCKGEAGPVVIKWEDLSDIAAGTAMSLQQRGHPQKVIALLTQQGTSTYKPLTWCIKRFSSYSCHEPRDRVYGLLGIVRERDRIAVDYNKSVQEVYLDVVRLTYTESKDRFRTTTSAFEHREMLKALANGMELADGDHNLRGLRRLLKSIFIPPWKPKHPTIESIGYQPRDGKSEQLGKSKALKSRDRWWYKHEGASERTWLLVCVCRAASCTCR